MEASFREMNISIHHHVDRFCAGNFGLSSGAEDFDTSSVDMLSLKRAFLILISLNPPPIKNPTPGDPKPVLNVAQYATISRKWQNAVERFTMADIKKYSTNLDMFRQVFSSP